jgi:hypothetical protein
MDFGEYLVFCVLCSCAWLACTVMLLSYLEYRRPILLTFMMAAIMVSIRILPFSLVVLTLVAYSVAVAMRPSYPAKPDTA